MDRIVYVEKPGDRWLVDKYGNDVFLKWEPSFAPRWNKRYYLAQHEIDAVVLYGCEQFITYDSGNLIRSGHRNTEIGSGYVIWGDKSPNYSRPAFYGRRAKRGVGPKVTKPLAWFRKWKSAHGKATAERVSKMVGS